MAVTLEVVQALLKNQTEVFNSSLKLMLQDLKDDIKSIRKDITDLQVSLQFTQGKLDESNQKLEGFEATLSVHSDNLNDINQQTDEVDNQLEYLENQSRRNNIRIIGIPENTDVETWDDTEKILKQSIKEKLKLDEDFEIERCHRVNRRTNNQSDRSDRPKEPRPIVAKFSKWKEKETVLRKAREIKPRGIRFLADLSSRTLQRRRAQVPQLIEARRQGKIAFFVLDKLIIKNKKPFIKPTRPPDNLNETTRSESEHEVSFDTF